MPILKVANVYFNSSGTVKIAYNNDNILRVVGSAVDIASGTTAGRPTAETGLLRFNTDTSKYEVYTGSAWENIVTGTVAGGASGNTIVRVYEAPTVWTRPTNCTGVKVTVVGGGGGGAPGTPGSTGSGGGGGGYAVKFLTPPSLASPVTVTVGAGGANGVPTGVTGGTSSFGAFVSATGGTGAVIPPGGSTVGAGGTGSGDYGISGSPGFLSSQGGRGGFSLLGAGGPTPAGDAGQKYGGGGGGGPFPAANGPQPGGVGVVIVEEFY